jgi:flagellar protein FliL
MAAKAKNAQSDDDTEDNDNAGEGTDAAEGGEGATKGWRGWLKLPKLSLKLGLIAGGALLVLVGGGGGAYYMFGRSTEPKPAAPPVKPAVFVDLPEVLVNLAGTSGERTQYLKVKVVLELSDDKLKEQIQPVMPRVMDAFQTYLRELRATDLDGSAGLYRLKEELTRRVNVAIAPGRINAVLFKEIVVQ